MLPTNLLIGIVGGLLFIGHGLWLIFVELLRVHHLRVWRTTTAQIVSSRVSTTDDGDGSVYVVCVGYSYNVEGREHYEEENLLKTGSQEVAERLRARYSAGTNVSIAYDPKNERLTELADAAHAALKKGVIVRGIVEWASGASLLFLALRGVRF